MRRFERGHENRKKKKAWFGHLFLGSSSSWQSSHLLNAGTMYKTTQREKKKHLCLAYFPPGLVVRSGKEYGMQPILAAGIIPHCLKKWDSIAPFGFLLKSLVWSLRTLSQIPIIQPWPLGFPPLSAQLAQCSTVLLLIPPQKNPPTVWFPGLHQRFRNAFARALRPIHQHRKT